MKSIPHLLILYLTEAKIKIAKSMEYRADFFLSILISLSFSLFGPLFQFLIYTKTNGYPGWSFDQILLFQAILLLWSGMIELLFGEYKINLHLVVQNGLFDRYMLMPYSSIGLLLTKGFTYRAFGTVVAGIVAMLIVVSRIEISIGLSEILLFILFIVAGLLLYISLLILYSVVALRLIYVDRLKEIFNKIVEFGSFPAEIFSGSFKFFYLAILPIGIWIYYPAQALLGRVDSYIIWTLLSIVLLFIVALRLWKMQLKKYTSAGG